MRSATATAMSGGRAAGSICHHGRLISIDVATSAAANTSTAAHDSHGSPACTPDTIVAMLAAIAVSIQGSIRVSGIPEASRGSIRPLA